MANHTGLNESDRIVTLQVVIITGVTGGVAVLTCLSALVLILALKLHTKLVYRLAAYQVLTSLVFAIANLLNLAAVDYHDDYKFSGDPTTRRVCQIVAFARMYSAWLKLLAVVFVTLHLYCYVVCYRNMKRCELVYVLVSLLLPITVSVVPFTFGTNSYGADGQWCWISTLSSYSELLKLLLWFGPAVFLLCIVTAAVAYLIVVLFRRACLESSDEFNIAYKQQSHKQAFNQMLPLLAYPVLFLIFLLPSLVSQVYREDEVLTDTKWLEPVNAFFSSLLSTSAGLTLMAHISTLWCATKRGGWRLHQRNYGRFSTY